MLLLRTIFHNKTAKASSSSNRVQNTVPISAMAMSCCENLRVEFYKQFRKLAIFFFHSSEEKEDLPPTWTTLQRRRSKARYVCVTKRGLHSCPLRVCCFVMALRICKLYVHILSPPPYNISYFLLVC